MRDPLQALIQMGVVPTVTFPTDSRYYGSGTLSYVVAERADDHLPGTPFCAAARCSLTSATVAQAYRAGRATGWI